MRQRLVIDTNVLVSGLLNPKSHPGLALRRAVDRHKVLVSEASLWELANVLSRPKLIRYVTPRESQDFIRQLGAVAEMVPILRPVHVCRDPHDDKILEVAVNGSADGIITGDADLLALHPFCGIRIVIPARWLEDHAGSE